jgi:hypothetical protein
LHKESRRLDFNPLACLAVFGGTERVGWASSGNLQNPHNIILLMWDVNKPLLGRLASHFLSPSLDKLAS